MAKLFVYIAFRYGDSRKSMLRTSLNLRDTLQTIAVGAEYARLEIDAALCEFQRCIDKKTGSNSTAELFADSVLATEILAMYFVTASSTAIEHLMAFRPTETHSLHLVYSFSKDPSQRFLVSESIYPGPNQMAPEHVSEFWLQRAFT